jgi:Bacterial protein of unknown function (DUF937)
MNIVQMILKLLSSSDVQSKIASALGISQEQVSRAISAAVPTLLAALAGTASKPGGAADVANAAAKQDAGVLDNLSSLFSGAVLRLPHRVPISWARSLAGLAEGLRAKSVACSRALPA